MQSIKVANTNVDPRAKNQNFVVVALRRRQPQRSQVLPHPKEQDAPEASQPVGMPNFPMGSPTMENENEVVLYRPKKQQLQTLAPRRTSPTKAA